MYNPFSLVGKTILVTGASSGIGKSIAIECSRMGAKLVIIGRNKERLNQTYSLLDGSGHMQIIGDLCDEDFQTNLINQCPSLNGLVHSVGIMDYTPFQFINNKKLDHIFNVNFFSSTYLSIELVKQKKLLKESSIVFISSISGLHITHAACSMYSATKGAINAFVKGMAVDLASRRIRVNTICPGMIQTNLLNGEQVTKEQLEIDMKKYPLGRYGNPEEVAYAAIYLLSDASVWVTGSNMVIDGGYTLL